MIKTLCLLGCAWLAFPSLAGEPAPPPARTRAEIDAQVDALTKRQLEEGDAVRDRIRVCGELWRNPRLTSPEIEELRRRLDALTRELSEVQAALKKRVMELPAAKDEMDRLEQARAAYGEIGRQIEALRKRRDQAP
jgi:chromosome segregation ATPase